MNRDKDGEQYKKRRTDQGRHRRIRVWIARSHCVVCFIVLLKLTLHVKVTSSPALARTVFGSSTISGASVVKMMMITMMMISMMMKIIMPMMKIMMPFVKMRIKMMKMIMIVPHATLMTMLASSFPSVLVAEQDTSFPVSLL